MVVERSFGTPFQSVCVSHTLCQPNDPHTHRCLGASCRTFVLVLSANEVLSLGQLDM